MRWFVSFALGLGLAALAPAGSAVATTRVHGAVLDDQVKKVGEDRFKSTEDWEKTIRFLRTVYGGKPGIIWRAIPTNTKVSRALHIENTLPRRTWDGINVYETGGDIFLFVLKTEDARK